MTIEEQYRRVRAKWKLRPFDHKMWLLARVQEAVVLQRLARIVLLGTVMATVACGVGQAMAAERMTLRAVPRMQLWSWRPAEVLVEAKVTGMTERLWCAEGTFMWGDGGVSSNHGDCDPYEMESHMGGTPHYWRNRHSYHGPGDYTVTFALSKAGRVLKRDSVLVVVKGWGSVGGGR